MRRKRIILFIALVVYFLISSWIDIPNKLFSFVDIIKNYFPEEWVWPDKIVDVAKYLLDKIGWTLFVFLIQKKYERHQTTCPPIRCKLLTRSPARLDNQLSVLPSNKKVKIGSGKYYYHFRLQLHAESTNYSNLSIKGLGANSVYLDYLGMKCVEKVDLVVFFNREKIICMLPICLTLDFCDNQNFRYKEKIVLTKKRGVYYCNTKAPRKY